VSAPSNPDQLLAVAERCGACVACDLAKTRKTVVFGEGNPVAQVMLVGEGPGADEDERGRPFVGKAGQLLDRILAAGGIERTEVYIANMVKCRPPGNRNPEAAEIKACEPWLLQQIRLIQPQIIVTLGNVPTQHFLGAHTRITRVRGQWHKINQLAPSLGVNVPVYPMFHPSYLLRNDSREKGSPKWQTWQDVLALKAAMDALPPKSEGIWHTKVAGKALEKATPAAPEEPGLFG
jgi:uracil-DNA glycosylase